MDNNIWGSELFQVGVTYRDYYKYALLYEFTECTLYFIVARTFSHLLKR